MCTTNIPDCFTSLQRKENSVFIHVVLNASLWANILTPLRGRCLVQETFIWSHTAFKRTCFPVDVSCNVHAALWRQWTAFFFFSFLRVNRLSLHVNARRCWCQSSTLDVCFFSPPHSTELFQSSAVDFSESVRLNRDTVASPALGLFFVSSFACFVASSPKDFLMPLQGNVFFFYIMIYAQASCAFLHIRFLWLLLFSCSPLKTHQSHFCHQSFKTVELRSSREGADCTDSNYNQSRWWALYSKYILLMMIRFTCGETKRRWRHQSKSRCRRCLYLKVPYSCKIHFTKVFSLLCLYPVSDLKSIL